MTLMQSVKGPGDDGDVPKARVTVLAWRCVRIYHSKLALYLQQAVKCRESTAAVFSRCLRGRLRMLDVSRHLVGGGLRRPSGGQRGRGGHARPSLWINRNVS